MRTSNLNKHQVFRVDKSEGHCLLYKGSFYKIIRNTLLFVDLSHSIICKIIIKFNLFQKYMFFFSFSRLFVETLQVRRFLYRMIFSNNYLNLRCAQKENQFPIEPLRILSLSVLNLALRPWTMILLIWSMHHLQESPRIGVQESAQ